MASVCGGDPVVGEESKSSVECSLAGGAILYVKFLALERERVLI